MPIVSCYGIHSDDVGIRYLVQDEVTNTYGFSEDFIVENIKPYKCPHDFPVKDFGKSREDCEIYSPIPHEHKGYQFTGPASVIPKLAKFSKALVLPAWLLSSKRVELICYPSNIMVSFIVGISPKYSYNVDRLLETIPYGNGKVILHGDYYFPKHIVPVTAPEDLSDAEAVGLSNLYKYLNEKD